MNTHDYFQGLARQDHELAGIRDRWQDTDVEGRARIAADAMVLQEKNQQSFRRLALLHRASAIANGTYKPPKRGEVGE